MPVPLVTAASAISIIWEPLYQVLQAAVAMIIYLNAINLESRIISTFLYPFGLVPAAAAIKCYMDTLWLQVTVPVSM